MNLNQILSIVRYLLTSGGSVLVAKGYGDNATYESIIGGLLALVSLLWSLWHHRTVPTLDVPKPPV